MIYLVLITVIRIESEVIDGCTSGGKCVSGDDSGDDNSDIFDMYAGSMVP